MLTIRDANDGRYHAQIAGQHMGIFANPACDLARILLSGRAQPSDTLTMSGPDAPTMIAMPLHRLGAPRIAPEKRYTWRQIGKNGTYHG
jgi:hypothetical protein